MKRVLQVVIVASTMLVFFFAVNRAFAGEIDMLVDKLVEKGVLTHDEAQQILTETKEQIKAELEAGKSESVPKWIQNIKLKGDFRLRYESSSFSGTSPDRNRGRFRLRLGMDAKVFDELMAHLRFASGTGEQVSTNQSFHGGFQNKDFDIDLAYVEYTPKFAKGNLTLLGGRMVNPFYSTDLMWDGDVNLEGAAFQVKMPLGDSSHTLFANGGAFFPNETSGISNDPTFFGIQGGISGKLFDRGYKIAVAYYAPHNFSEVTVAALFPGKQFNTNTLNGGSYAYGFDIIDINAEYSPLDVTLFGKTLPVKVFGNFLMNVSSDVKDNDNGFQFGLKLGKAKNPGDWDLGYAFKAIQADATVAELADSDWHGGGTNLRGHKYSLNYCLAKNTFFGLTYFNTWEESGSKSHTDTLQVDMLFKF